MENKNIEDIQLKGITPKIIVWLIGCTITICTTILMAWFNLNNQNKDLKNSLDLHSGKISTLETENKTRINEIKELSSKQQTLKEDNIIIKYKLGLP